MNDTNMNRLPVPTWNQCGVNTAPAAAALPENPGDWGEANFAVTLPAGVGESEEEFTAFAESGMGAETDAFVLENATVRHALTVAEGVTVAEPAVFEFLILFDTRTFELQRQLRSSELPSQSEFFVISKHFTATPRIPPTLCVLKETSSRCSSDVEHLHFTTRLISGLRSL